MCELYQMIRLVTESHGQREAKCYSTHPLSPRRPRNLSLELRFDHGRCNCLLLTKHGKGWTLSKPALDTSLGLPWAVHISHTPSLSPALSQGRNPVCTGALQRHRAPKGTHPVLGNSHKAPLIQKPTPHASLCSLKRSTG